MRLKHGAALIIFIHEQSNCLGASKSGFNAPFQSLLSTLSSTNHPSHLWVQAYCEPSHLWALPHAILTSQNDFSPGKPLTVSGGLIHSWRHIPQCPGVQFIPPPSLPLNPRFTLLVSDPALICLVLCLPPGPQMGGSLTFFILAWPAPSHPSGISSNVTSSSSPSWTI